MNNKKKSNKFFWAIFSFLALVAFLFFGCENFSVPKSISIKTPPAKYEIPLGKLDTENFFSPYTFMSKLIPEDDEAEGRSKIKIYDYNPGGNSQYMQFLIHYSLLDIPLNVNEYLDGVNLGNSITKQIASDLKFPAVEFTQSQKIVLPDFCQKIDEAAKKAFNEKTITIIEGVGIDANLSSFTVDLSDDNFNFSQIFFDSGKLKIRLEKNENDDNFSQDWSFSISAQITNGQKKINSNEAFFSGLNLNDVSLEFDLAGETLSPKFAISFSVKSSGGNASLLNWHEFSLSLGAENTKIQKIVGLNFDLGDGANKNFSMDAFSEEEFKKTGLVEATIDQGNLTMQAQKSGWSGITFDYSSLKISQEGSNKSGLSIASEDWKNIKRDTSNGYILNDNLSLKGKTLSNKTIKIEGSVTTKIQNATIVFSNGGKNEEISINILFALKSLSSAKISMGSFFDSSEGKSLKFELTEKLPEDVAKSVKEIQFSDFKITAKFFELSEEEKKSGIKPFPEENDLHIKLNLVSKTFGIPEGAQSNWGSIGETAPPPTTPDAKDGEQLYLSLNGRGMRDGTGGPGNKDDDTKNNWVEESKLNSAETGCKTIKVEKLDKDDGDNPQIKLAFTAELSGKDENGNFSSETPITIKNLEFNQPYKMQLEFNAEYSWTWMSLDLNADSTNSQQITDGEIDTGIDFDNFFGVLGEKSHMRGVTFPGPNEDGIAAYIYISSPSGDLFKQFSLAPEIIAYTSKQRAKSENPEPTEDDIILYENGKSENQNLIYPPDFDEYAEHMITKNGDDIAVVKKSKDELFAEGTYYGKIEKIHEVFNKMLKIKENAGFLDNPDNALVLKYNVKLGGGDGKIEIKNDDLFKNTTESTSIAVNLVLLFPFMVKVDEDPRFKGEGDPGLLIDFLDMAGVVQDDILSRKSSEDFNEIRSYVDVIEKIGVSYKCDTAMQGIMKFSGVKNLGQNDEKAIFTKQMELQKSNKVLEFSLDYDEIQSLLDTAPVAPRIVLTAGGKENPNAKFAFPRSSSIEMRAIVNLIEGKEIKVWN